MTVMASSAWRSQSRAYRQGSVTFTQTRGPGRYRPGDLPEEYKKYLPRPDPSWTATPRIRPGYPGQTTGPHHTDVKIPGGKGPVNVRDIARYAYYMAVANFNVGGPVSFVCNYAGASRPSEKFQIFCGLVYDLGEYGLRPGGREIHFARPGSGTTGQTGVVYPVAVQNGNLHLPRLRRLGLDDYKDPVPEPWFEIRPDEAQPNPWKEWAGSANPTRVRVRERQIKVRSALQSAERAGPIALFLLRLVLRGVNAATESADLIWAIYWALPGEYRGPDHTPVEAAQRIWQNWEQINLRRALKNIISNQLEDALIGSAGQGYTKYRQAVWEKYGVDIGSEPGSTGFGGLGGPGEEALPGLDYFFPEEMKEIRKRVREWENEGPDAGDFDIIP